MWREHCSTIANSPLLSIQARQLLSPRFPHPPSTDSTHTIYGVHVPREHISELIMEVYICSRDKRHAPKSSGLEIIV